MIFYTKIFLEYPAYVSSRCLDRYRQHPGSNTSLAVKDGIYDPTKPNPAQGAYLNWVADFLTQKRCRRTELWQILQRELWPYRHPHLYRLVNRLRRIPRFVQSLVRAIVRRTLPMSARNRLRDVLKGTPLEVR
jgi:hypothetical protein